MKHYAKYIGRHGLFCIVSEPLNRTSDAALVMLNSGLLPNYGPYRLYNEIARVANELGYVVVRVDQSGKGESEPRLGLTRLETLQRDYADVLDFLATLNVSSTLVAGLCSGADDALALIPAQSSIVGAILLDGYASKNLKFYFYHALALSRKLVRWQSWRTLVSILFRRGSTLILSVPPLDVRDMGSGADKMSGYRILLERGGHILAVFTASIPGYYNHSGQLTANLKGTAQLGNLVEHRFDRAEHIYPTLSQRSQLVSLIRDWLATAL